EQSRAEVVDAARELVQAAELRITYASFQWEWCNDQGEPPFRGRVDLAWEVPVGETSPAVSKRIAATAAQQPGWAAGPPPGLQPTGDVVHTGGVMV
ncbi:hypothetical protein C6A85_68805, partial [Mycobacterium sp. ITM-2017-0098]